MLLKSIIGAVCTCLAVVSFNVTAIPMYDYNATGEITGVTGLEVDGALWNMTLHDGSFIDLMESKGSSAIYTHTFALAASVALDRFTYATSPDPDSFFGCTVISVCYITTAYEYSEEIDLVYLVADIVTTEPFPGEIHVEIGAHLNSPAGTMATWTAVPEPSIAILMASGLIAFGVIRRKVRI